MRLHPGFKLRTVLNQPMIVAESADLVNFNKMITLNDSAAYLWQCAEGHDIDAEALADALVDKYGIDRNTALTDVKEMINLWNENGLIED